ncbi:DEP domain-containing protein 7-like [Megalops cyprinoides]|uniref:DEP domain-containing protein 7-like n=1 Tax=Megalops cyprinoides TaxID=118141 RepID=UPI0018655A31|nr:DEP domain-containing protein 7-like [Megalops cyprinoides]
MATVKEMAAALNLSGTFLHPPPVDCRMASEPFRATYIWSSIINNLQTRVEVKRRRHNLKSHNDCFLGSEAVDVILEHIVQHKFFGELEIPRAKVVRVCQNLMDCKVFEPVGTKVFRKEKRATFEDSNVSLYRFLNTQNTSTNSLETGSDTPGIQRTIYNTPCRRRDEPIYANCTPARIDMSLEHLLGDLNVNPTNALSKTRVDEVWREQALLRLLKLIDLPMLDTLLEGLESHQPPLHSMDSDFNLLYTRNYLDREVLKAFSASQEDRWLSAAVDCLEFLPDQLVVEVSSGLPSWTDDPQQCKRLLFSALTKHYSQPKFPPLLTNHMFDIHSGITELIVNGKLERALEALQLCLRLLPPHNREELRRLLCFMAVAAKPQEIKLHKEIENRMAVKRAFTRAIVHSKHLAKGKVDLLVLLLLDNHSEVFKIPGALHKLVSDKLVSILHGKDSDLITDAPYCQQLPNKSYKEVVKNTTKEELLVLLRSIHENPKLSSKEKKRLLEQFYKGHPEIFVQYFWDQNTNRHVFRVYKGQKFSHILFQPISPRNRDAVCM